VGSQCALDGTRLIFVARVPTVEMAVVIKAYAYASRRLGRVTGCLKSSKAIHRTPSAAGGSTEQTFAVPGAMPLPGCRTWNASRGG
jgi:hypothetical protein